MDSVHAKLVSSSNGQQQEPKFAPQSRANAQAETDYR